MPDICFILNSESVHHLILPVISDIGNHAHLETTDLLLQMKIFYSLPAKLDMLLLLSNTNLNPDQA